MEGLVVAHEEGIKALSTTDVVTKRTVPNERVALLEFVN